MKGADNIKSVILEQANENAEKILKDSANKCQEILDEGKKDIENFMLTQAEKFKADQQTESDKTNTEGRLFVRKFLLMKKQEIISQAFEKTSERLNALKGQEYVDILVGIIKKNASAGGEILLDEETLKLHGAEILKALGENFTLCSKSANIGKGAVIKNGNIEINCRFSALISAMKDIECQEVSNILFGG